MLDGHLTWEAVEQRLGQHLIHVYQEAQVEGRKGVWEERVGVAYSPSLARKARRGLAQRLKWAEQKLRALTPPSW